MSLMNISMFWTEYSVWFHPTFFHPWCPMMESAAAMMSAAATLATPSAMVHGTGTHE